MKKGAYLKMKERLDLIKRIQKHLKENKKDGLLIYEENHSEPYFIEIVGAPCSNSLLFYIPAEEKPKCLVTNLEINAIKSTGLFEEKDLIEYTTISFSLAAKDFLKGLKGKNILVNFSEKDPLVDQLAHSFVKNYLQEVNMETSENLWKNMSIERKGKEYLFSTSLKTRKSRIKELKNKMQKDCGFLMINGIGKASSQTYACYLTGFLKNQKYAIAVKPEEAVAIVHKDEFLNKNPFDKVLRYKNVEELQKIISECFKDVKEVSYDDDMTEGNYRLAKKTLDTKLKESTKNLVHELLAVKLPEEVKEMEKACKINDKIFSYLEKKLKAGMSEKEISKLIEDKALSCPEALELSFPSLISAGKNGADIHHATSDYKIQEGDLLLVDIGIRLKTGMGSDTTCMYYFGKSIPERIRKYDKVMDKAIRAAVKKIGPGRYKLDVDRTTRKEITKYYPNYEHGTGHGVDTKCHGSSNAINTSPQGFFGTGEVFTIEPGVYITEKDVSKEHPYIEGFRKEIMVLVTKDGVKNISKIPKLRLIKR